MNYNVIRNTDEVTKAVQLELWANSGHVEISPVGLVSKKAKWVAPGDVVEIETYPSWYGEFIGGDPLLESGEIYHLDSDDVIDSSEPDYYIEIIAHGGQCISKDLFKRPYKVYKILGPCGHYH